MIILGLNAFHGDSAAALVRDGELVAAAEEERFRRVKHWAGFPSQAIAYCLQEAGLTLADVRPCRRQSGQPRQFLAEARLSADAASEPQACSSAVSRTGRTRSAFRTCWLQAFPAAGFAARCTRSSITSRICPRPFTSRPSKRRWSSRSTASAISASAAWGVGRGSDISIDGRVYFPHSLGIFYQALTQYLGFPHYGDEYKVMGLAPYGRPRAMEAMREIVRLKPMGRYELDLSYFRHHKEQISYQWAERRAGVWRSVLARSSRHLLGPRRMPDDPLEDRHRDIARSVQAMYEEAFFHLIGELHERHGLTDLALAGGCAMNSVANGKVRRMTPFRRVYVQSAAGDAGGAIGAAFALWHKLGGGRSFVMDHAYWGPQFEPGRHRSADCRRGKTRSMQAGCSIEKIADEAELCRRTAAAIADGKVVGWFQGRMEWGPRALGNRSILCDPRRADMKAILNAKIKRRESFRPFAPSVLEEAVADWFEEDDDVPFMMQVFQIREEKRALIPAVTHVDGSGRLQTVSRRTNPRYHRLIESFRDLTGVPMVLNTSFNENEPVVCEPEEALDCFLRTKWTCS